MRVDDVIHIDAPPEVVWAVTQDVGRWPEWTPTVTAVTRVDQGPFGLGSVARIKQPLQPQAPWVVTEFVTELAFHVVNLAICMNPVRIAVGGGMVRSWDRLRPGLQHALSEGMPFPPELVAARFPSDAPLIGAVALAMDAALAGAAAHPVADGGDPVSFPPITLSEGLPS